jgi:uncharacterized protein YlbG (UPF0298 family)
MKTKFYIIPGCGETARSYRWLIVEAAKKYDVVFLNLQLKGNSLLEFAKTRIERNSVVFGFSTGALIAYKLKTPVRKGIYCSMANLLEEDIKSRGALREMIKLFGKRTVDEFKRIRYGEPKAKKVVMFSGDREITERMARFMRVKKVKIVKDTGHRFTENYKKAVLKEI